MNETTAAVARKSKSLGRRLLDIWQTIIVLFVVLFVAVLLGEIPKLSAPGAPKELFWAAVTCGSLVSIAHLPPVFTRWPQRLRPLIYMAIPSFLLAFAVTIEGVQDAWKKTAKGAAEARAQAEADQVQALLNKQQEQRATELRLEQQATAREQQAANNVQERHAKLEQCFSTFGHRLPKLEQTVREGLGNPDSFDQVKTQGIVAEADGYNVVMTFRAQNRMGALWTYDVRATVDPESCDITNVEPEPHEA